jgi:S-adenosylmethionine hydrolase
MGAIITLTTDFGLADGYVAAMKGVVLGINPDANLVDICHSIKPQNISQAAFVLGTCYEFFPRRTIHLVVIDPGVGTDRRAVILRTPMADFVAPDNGVLSYVIQPYSTQPLDADQPQIKLGPGLEAVAITRPQFWRSPVSATFHGRDIFAPVAAHLSLGLSPADFGETITSLTVLPLTHPQPAPDGTLVGHILHIDNFGNLITSIRGSDLPQKAEAIKVEVGNQTISGLSQTYGTGEGLLALIGSSGYLEISLKEGNAGTFLKADVGDEVKIIKSTHKLTNI